MEKVYVLIDSGNGRITDMYSDVDQINAIYNIQPNRYTKKEYESIELLEILMKSYKAKPYLNQISFGEYDKCKIDSRTTCDVIFNGERIRSNAEISGENFKRTPNYILLEYIRKIGCITRPYIIRSIEEEALHFVNYIKHTTTSMYKGIDPKTVDDIQYYHMFWHEVRKLADRVVISHVVMSAHDEFVGTSNSTREYYQFGDKCLVRKPEDYYLRRLIISREFVDLINDCRIADYSYY